MRLIKRLINRLQPNASPRDSLLQRDGALRFIDQIAITLGVYRDPQLYTFVLL